MGGPLRCSPGSQCWPAPPSFSPRPTQQTYSGLPGRHWAAVARPVLESLLFYVSACALCPKPKAVLESPISTLTIFGSFQSLSINFTLPRDHLVTVQGSRERKIHRVISQGNILPRLLITTYPLLHSPLQPYPQQERLALLSEPLEADSVGACRDGRDTGSSGKRSVAGNPRSSPRTKEEWRGSFFLEEEEMGELQGQSPVSGRQWERWHFKRMIHILWWLNVAE